MNQQDIRLQSICQFLENDNDVLAAVVVGSQARIDYAADEYSDIDIIVIVIEPEQYLFSNDWLTGIGDFHVSFIEPTLFGAKERRILFDDGTDVDFIILGKEQSQAIQGHEAGDIFARGYKIIKDKTGLSESIENAKDSAKAISYTVLSGYEFHNLINDFWFHSVWTVKKISRGELYTAKSCLDIYMKRLLLTLIENYTRISSKNDVWYNGRFIEKWAERWIIDGLANAYSKYNRPDMIDALLSTMDIFKTIALDIAEKQYFTYPNDAEVHAYKIVNQLIQNNTNIGR